ncbi:hypothetical protein [Exiguobacterium antarcticum]|uniref:hypothetical protein n=1 Tax=Exiguobacterium antarcticum TaxID=132920 RepID=UPI000AF1AE99|nr:hypothetical protein [Exiguobacterium antarcticum]
MNGNTEGVFGATKLVPGKRFEANKKAVLLDKEKNRYFVFSLKSCPSLAYDLFV